MSWYANAGAVLMLSTTASGLYWSSSWNRRLRSSTSSVRSPSRSPSTSARCSGVARTVVQGSRAVDAGLKTLPQSTAIVVRPQQGPSPSAAAPPSSTTSATGTSCRGGGCAASTRRATAWPTRPLPPSSITVRSASSMSLLDRLDFLPCELAPFAFGQPAQPHGTVRHAVEPFDLEAQRLGHAAHDPLPAFGECHLHLERFARRTHAGFQDAHLAAVDHDPFRELGAHRGRVGAVNAEPVRARHLQARMHEAVGRRAGGGEEEQTRGHHVQPSNVRETGHLGEEVEHGAPSFRVGPAHHVAEGLVEREPRGAPRGAGGTAGHRGAPGLAGHARVSWGRG